MDRFTVGVRIRPPIDRNNERFDVEAAAKPDDCTVLLSNMGHNGIQPRRHTFTFDHVWDREDTQEDVYERGVVELVDDVLEGTNATAMCYGQTGSGKTFTALGFVNHNPLSGSDLDLVAHDTGMYLRIFRDLFVARDRRRATQHLLLSLSVLEIYNEQVRDLLASPEAGGAEVQVQITDGDVRLPNLTEVEVVTLRDAFRWYKVAMQRRQSRSTAMNDASSRSHALFLINAYRQAVTPANPSPPPASLLFAGPDPGDCDPFPPPSEGMEPRPAGRKAGARSASAVRSRSGSRTAPAHRAERSFSVTQPKRDSPPAGAAGSALPRAGPTNSVIPVAGQPPIHHSRFALVDLAGSEKQKHSQAKGEALQEMICINKSLTALGNVVHALYAAQRHVPYRDSKLTAILRPNFAAPNSKVLLIANAAPTVAYFEETLSTLYFAQKVKAMNVAVTDLTSDAVRPYLDWLAQQRRNEEVLADLRICRAIHDTTRDVPLVRQYNVRGAGAQGKRDLLRRIVAACQEEERDRQAATAEAEQAQYQRCVAEAVAERRQALRAVAQQLREEEQRERDAPRLWAALAAQGERVQEEGQALAVVQQEAQWLEELCGERRKALQHCNVEMERLVSRLGQAEAQSTAARAAADGEWVRRTRLHDLGSDLLRRLHAACRRYKQPLFNEALHTLALARDLARLTGAAAAAEATDADRAAAAAEVPNETPEAWERYFREMGRRAAARVGDASLWNVPPEGPAIFHSEFNASLPRVGKRTIAVRWLPHVPFEHLRPPGSVLVLKAIVTSAIKGHRAISPLGGFCIQVATESPLCSMVTTRKGALVLHGSIQCDLDASVAVVRPGPPGEPCAMRAGDFLASAGHHPGSQANDLPADFLFHKGSRQAVGPALANAVLPTSGRDLQRLAVPAACAAPDFRWAIAAGATPLRSVPFQVLHLNTGEATHIWYTFTPRQADNATIDKALRRLAPRCPAEGGGGGDAVADPLLVAAEVRLPLDILVQPPGWLVVLEPGRWHACKALGYAASLHTCIATHTIGQIRALRDHLALYGHAVKWPILWIATRLTRRLRLNSPVMVSLVWEMLAYYGPTVRLAHEVWHGAKSKSGGACLLEDRCHDFDDDAKYSALVPETCASCGNSIQVLSCHGRCVDCWRGQGAPPAPVPWYRLYVSLPMYDHLASAVEAAAAALTEQPAGRAAAILPAPQDRL